MVKKNRRALNILNGSYFGAFDAWIRSKIYEKVQCRNFRCNWCCRQRDA